jgi:hypothetical protein
MYDLNDEEGDFLRMLRFGTIVKPLKDEHHWYMVRRLIAAGYIECCCKITPGGC